MSVKELSNMKIRKQDQMLFDEAYQRGIKIEKVSEKRIMISNGEQDYIVKNGNIRDCANHPLAIKMIKLKDVSSRMLRNKGFNAVENMSFNYTDIKRAWRWAKDILPVVLKPTSGNLGKSVYVNINTYDEFKRYFSKIAKNNQDILVEKFITGEEYRFTYLNNRILTINRNVSAHVIADGKHTISELIHFKNVQREDSTVYKKLKLNKKSEYILSDQGFTMESIPKDGQIVFVRNTSNIATGAEAIDMTDEMDEEIKEHVRKAVSSLKGLFLCGVDVLIAEGTPYIMEINNLPGLLTDEYLPVGYSREVIPKIIDELFPETVNKAVKSTLP